MALGLTTTEAKTRSIKYGPNAIPEEKPNLLLNFLKKMWGPVPWMLELIVVLELFIGRYTQSIIIGFLLVFNAWISYFQEKRAHDALALLQQRLAIKVKVLRDGIWQVLPSQELVPGDVIHIRVGDFIPADLHLLDGHISVDQSALTGESLPVEKNPEDTAYTGGIVQRGEADGEVTATGIHTFYGKTAELVNTAKTASHLETLILGIVRYLVAVDILLVVGVLVYTGVKGFSYFEAIPFALMVLVASVPVALPATFTLASALGAQELARSGVLVTRLTAIEEAATMDVLCSDKTGTITENKLAISAVLPYGFNSESYVLQLAALASDESTQDPIDMAILQKARERGLVDGGAERVNFIPFDPLTKRTEATAQLDGREVRIIKGMPEIVSGLVSPRVDPSVDVDCLSEKGYRVLAVAAGEKETLSLAGLIGLYDPPRADSKTLIQNLESLAVRVMMVTGDGLATAKAIADQVGLGSVACHADKLRQGLANGDLNCDVIAGVLPEDKFNLVRSLQKAGHVVGMTGDGVNDAPALKQAEIGIAVSNATDVARAAASAVLTSPGLSNLLDAVKIGRQIYQRMLTYTYNKIIKTFQIALFLALGLFVTGIFVTTPRLVVLLLFANDFVTMSISSDRVRYSHTPEHWHIPQLVGGSLVMAVAWLAFAFGTLFMGLNVYHLDVAKLQTLVFAMLVFTGQANVYLVRERRHFWESKPGRLLLLSSLGDIIVITFLTTQGILMEPISITLVGTLVGSIIIFAFLLDFLKVLVFKRMALSS